MPTWLEYATKASRVAQDDRFVRKWLQLRLGAFVRGRSVAADVTVELLRRMDVSHCPVTRERLTHATRLDTDASVDRLNNDGAYAASNLAMMSATALLPTAFRELRHFARRTPPSTPRRALWEIACLPPQQRWLLVQPA